MTEDGIVIEVNPEQLLNAKPPILVTESGIVSCPVNPEQPLNAEERIKVTEDGIVSCPVNPEQP